MEAHIECDSCYELRVKRIKEEKYPPIKCTTEWSVQDVHLYRIEQGYSKWTDEQAINWLHEHKGYMQEQCVQSGHEIINNFMEE